MNIRSHCVVQGFLPDHTIMTAYSCLTVFHSNILPITGPWLWLAKSIALTTHFPWKNKTELSQCAMQSFRKIYMEINWLQQHWMCLYSFASYYWAWMIWVPFFSTPPLISSCPFGGAQQVMWRSYLLEQREAWKQGDVPFSVNITHMVKDQPRQALILLRDTESDIIHYEIKRSKLHSLQIYTPNVSSNFT